MSRLDGASSFNSSFVQPSFTFVHPAAAIVPLATASTPSGQQVLCVNTATAAGVQGYDYMRPWAPGHANLSLWTEDPQTQSSHLVETMGFWPNKDDGTMSKLWDDFIPTGDSRVRFNDPEDSPFSGEFPFSYCQPVAADGVDALHDLAAQQSEYQFYGPNCTTFAEDGFNAGVQQSVFGGNSYAGVEAPFELGGEIEALNGGAAANVSGGAFGWNDGIDPSGDSDFIDGGDF